MNEQYNEQFGDSKETVQPPQYSYNPADTADENDPVIIRRKFKKGYGWAGLAMILQFIFINVAVIIGTVIYSSAESARFMTANPNATQDELLKFTTELSQNLMSNMLFLLIVTAAGYLVGNIASTLIASSSLNAFKIKDFFGKIKTPASSVVLAAFVILGVQAVSIFAQMLISSFTGYTGVDETTNAMLSFSDNMAANILLLVYTVIIAPITEELLMRGYVLYALSPVNRTFGIIASSLLFGLMH
ncbi:MAG: CPBP family intramembrane metalloprotease, partial [Ruminococcus sp.]|nr:CPBP family intramembrane metalloprotease [Ruminococcus sp.]